MPSIADSVVEMVQWVFPEHAGAPGQIHGGRMMQWIATCGTIAASRVARGNVVLGAMDDIDFLHPVKVGQVAVLRAQVEYVGRCSLEVGVRVHAEKFMGRGEPGASEILVNLFDPDYLMKHDLVFIGSPQTVTEKLRAAAEAGVFNTFLGEFSFSDLPESDLMRSIRLFGEKVMPALRDYEPF